MLGTRKGRSRLTAFVGLIGMAAVAATAAGCAWGPGSPSSGPSSSPSRAAATAVPTTTPSAHASPTTVPGEPWAGIAWSSAATANLPWDGEPDQLVDWKGGYLGLGAAGGHTVVARSSDLVDWEVTASGDEVPFEANGFSQLIAGPDLLVAIHPKDGITRAGLWTSADGATWAASSSTPSGFTDLTGAAVGKEGILALAYLGWQKPAMWLSQTGKDWKQVDMSGPEFASANLNAVFAVRGGFVVTGGLGGSEPAGIGDPGGRPCAWWSADGLRWTLASVPQMGQAMRMSTVYPAARGYVAEGFRMGLWSSADGRKWNALSKTPWNAANFDVTFYADGDHVVALTSPLGADGPVAMWSTVDGSNWQALPMSGGRGISDHLPDKVLVTADGVVFLETSTDSGDRHVLVLRARAVLSQ